MKLFGSEDASALQSVATNYLSRATPFHLMPLGGPVEADIVATWQAMYGLGWQDIVDGRNEATRGESAQNLAALFAGVGAHPTAVPLVDLLVGVPLIVSGTSSAVIRDALADGAIVTLGLYGEDELGCVDGNVWNGAVFDDAGAVGTKTMVRGAAMSSAFLITGRRAGERVIALVRASDPRVSIAPLLSPDRLAGLGTVRLDQAAYEVALTGDAAQLVYDQVVALSRVAVLAELVGLATCAVAQSVEYAEVRHQFDRPIGSFQAVQHMLAEGRLAQHGLESVLLHVIDTMSGGDWAQSRREADRALLYAVTAIEQAMDVALQVHGGIGYTLEYPLSWYYLRAASLRTECADPSLLAASVGAEAVYAATIS